MNIKKLLSDRHNFEFLDYDPENYDEGAGKAKSSLTGLGLDLKRAGVDAKLGKSDDDNYFLTVGDYTLYQPFILAGLFKVKERGNLLRNSRGTTSWSSLDIVSFLTQTMSVKKSIQDNQRVDLRSLSNDELSSVEFDGQLNGRNGKYHNFSKDQYNRVFADFTFEGSDEDFTHGRTVNRTPIRERYLDDYVRSGTILGWFTFDFCF